MRSTSMGARYGQIVRRRSYPRVMPLSVEERQQFLAEPHVAALFDAAGRVSLMVDEVRPRVRYVSVEGPVVRTEPGDIDVVRTMTARYLPAERVETYVEFA